MLENFNSKEKIYLYLKSHHLAALSTVSTTKEPHGALIYIFADPELNFYFFTKAKTQKAQNLEVNREAALTIFDPVFPRTIQSEGTVERIMEKTLYDKLFTYFMEHAAKKEEEDLYWPPPLSKVYIHEELFLYKFEPKWLRFADFSESKTFLHVNLENNFFQVIPPQDETT